MKKLFILFVTALISLSTVFALPGFEPIVPDHSGEYVYYRDFTFERESYIGFLSYDQKTYSARYFAPAEKKSKLPQKEIQIFFTINPDAKYLELTGEKVLNIQLLTEEDLKIVNYLHDLLYEFNSRRIKLVENNVLSGMQDELESLGKITTYEDFTQFGGSARISWNTIIPFFNIESIYNEDEAKNVFMVATIGRINSTDDKSFENFKGFSEDFMAKKHKAKINTKAEDFVIQNKTTGNTYILHKDWKQPAENMFTLGDFAVFFETSIPGQKQNFIKRQLLLSSGENYIDFSRIEFKNNLIKANYYNFQTGNVTTTFKRFEKKSKSEQFAYCSLSVFNDVYKKNSKYFDKITESFSAEE